MNHDTNQREVGPLQAVALGSSEAVALTRCTVETVTHALTLTAVFTPDDDGWTMAQLAEWPAVVTCGRTVDEARAMLLDAARDMLASYRDEGREPPIGGGHAEQLTIDVAAA
jgi:predicted RNase H-like HicB family nuclease